DPVDSTREPLRSLLLGVDFVFLEAESNRYEFFLDVIRESPPDLAIVNLDADKQKAINLVTQLAHDHPRLSILVISNDNQAILQALQRGAKHFLMVPVVLEDLLLSLRRIMGESGVQDQGRRTVSGGQPSQIIAVMGSRGGIGCTTLAVNIACNLAASPSNSVALVDLDLALGDADVSLDLMPDHTLADLVMNIEKLDLNFIKRSMLKHESTGLHVLAHPVQMADIGIIQPAHVERVLNLLRINYTHLVLDVSKGLSPTDLVALDMADTILLVAQCELSSLRNVVRILMSLGNVEGVAEKVRVVINRVGSEFAEAEISLKKAENTIAKPIYWQVPNDAKSVLTARVAGEPLLIHAPKCRAQQSIAALAQALTNQAGPEAHGAPTPTGSTGFLKGLFKK
ncbi:MAG TPA: AAA family ATPase, partial [Gemmataceae bacterium]|nr:AAA family ATPase [Gemmataceae bacterium]